MLIPDRLANKQKNKCGQHITPFPKVKAPRNDQHVVPVDVQ